VAAQGGQEARLQRAQLPEVQQRDDTEARVQAEWQAVDSLLGVRPEERDRAEAASGGGGMSLTLQQKALLFDRLSGFISEQNRIAPATPMPAVFTKDDMFRRIIEVSAKIYGVEWFLIDGQDRRREIVRARQLVYTLCRKHLGWSLQRIGDNFNRDHTSVSHGLKAFKDTEALQNAEAALGLGGDE